MDFGFVLVAVRDCFTDAGFPGCAQSDGMQLLARERTPVDARCQLPSRGPCVPLAGVWVPLAGVWVAMGARLAR